MEIYRGRTPYYDEGLARSTDFGVLTHRAIATLATRSNTPSLEEQTRAVEALLGGVRPIEKRAHRQNLRAAVMSYFSRLALPDPWQLGSTETRLGRGRVDLIWRSPDGQVLIDEVKTGHHRWLSTSTVQLQVHEYVVSGLAQWGPAFLGCRLLSTHDPATSTFTGTSLQTVPLTSTPYRK